MSDEERYDFERLLERDPFLAEAYEGMSELKMSEVEHDLQNIHFGSVKNGIKVKSIVSLLVAATVAVAIVLFVLIRQPETEQLLLVEDEQESVSQAPFFERAIVPVDIDSGNIIQDDTTRILLAQDEASSKQLRHIETLSEDVGNDTKKKQLLSLDVKKEAIESDPIIKDIQAVKSASVSQVDDVGRVKVQKIASEKNIVRDNVDEKMIVESAISEEKSVLDEVPVIEEDSGLEVIEVDEAIESKRMGVNAKPQPMGGESRFKAYLDDNLHYPTSIDGNRREVVRVQFEVSLRGNPQNFSILKSPDDPGFSEEAIRLIKEGPRWSPAVVNGNPVVDVLIVRVVFKPDK
jgi:hypothetical protein